MAQSTELMRVHPAWPEFQALHPTVRERGFENDFVKFLGARERGGSGVQGVIDYVENLASEEIYQALAEERRPR